MEILDIELDKLIRDPKIQCRVSISEDCIQNYADAYESGIHLPPIVVFSDGENFWAADGFQRIAAAKKVDFKVLPAEVYEGTYRGAILYAVGANAAHGLPRTNDDKRKAVLTLLKDEEWGSWSDGEIAKQCKVTQPFVSKVRRKLTQNSFESNNRRKGKDGRIIDTTKIGSRSNQVETPSLDIPDMSEPVILPDPTDNQGLPISSPESDPEASDLDHGSLVDYGQGSEEQTASDSEVDSDSTEVIDGDQDSQTSVASNLNGKVFIELNLDHPLSELPKFIDIIIEMKIGTGKMRSSFTADFVEENNHPPLFSAKNVSFYSFNGHPITPLNYAKGPKERFN